MFNMQRNNYLLALLLFLTAFAKAQSIDSTQLNGKLQLPTYKIRVLESTNDNSAIELANTIDPNDSNVLFNLEMDIKDQLIGIDSIIELAKSYSPSLKFQSALVETGVQALKLTRRDWLRNIYGSSSYYVGNQNNLAYSADPISNANSLYINGYRTGATITIPLYDIFSRKTQISLSKAELEAKRYRKEEVAFQITQQVIASYNTLIATYNVLKVLSMAAEVSSTNYQFAEKEFRESSISIAELSKLAELHFKSKADFEYGKSAFFTAYSQLEYFVGVKMPQLIKKN